MPLHERFATGTKWVLTVGAHTWPPGTVVTVQGPPGETQYEGEMVVPVSFPDGSMLDVSLDILG